MCIFQISSSHSKKYPKLEDDEAQSIEKKPRKSNKRESLAASEFSMGSPSYGSFTTYERIPAKHSSFPSVVNAAVTQLQNLHGEIDMASNSARVSYGDDDFFSSTCLNFTRKIYKGLEEIDLQATKLHEFECFFNNRVRFCFSSVPVLEHVKISIRGDTSMPYIFGEFAANLPAQVKSLIVTTWNTQVTHFPTEMQIFRNPRMLVLLFESTYNFDIVKVSPVLDACPVLQSLVKNDSAESKPDKMSTIKSRSMSYGNKVLPYYRSSSSTSSYNVGNKRRQSTGKLNALDCGQDVIPHYVRASIGSFHDFCKYGRKRSSEEKPWHPLSRRKNKLPADEQSPARTLVGEEIKGTFVKKKLSTPPGSVLGEKRR
ncbi:hypothetical protein CQW23_29829 [Capsicum baccatum]|uniref:Uncharacterized protein n=1 Tax=Capsicum baccatum TaxID=33114 RepID=A0A2G2VC15_CAPBA|nr:hypothetical protein CQW23_29829 [Capsicum baccatum]